MQVNIDLPDDVAEALAARNGADVPARSWRW